MNKKLILIVSAIFLVATIIAGTLTINNVTIPAKEETPTTTSDGTFTFYCGKNLTSVQGNEPDGKWDKNDVESLIRSVCSYEFEVTQIKNPQGQLFKEYDGVYSFNETYLEEIKVEEEKLYIVKE